MDQNALTDKLLFLINIRTTWTASSFDFMTCLSAIDSGRDDGLSLDDVAGADNREIGAQIAHLAGGNDMDLATAISLLAKEWRMPMLRAYADAAKSGLDADCALIPVKLLSEDTTGHFVHMKFKLNQ